MALLTAEDRAIRLTGVGASESPAVLEIDPVPKHGPLRVWCRKPTKSRGPLLVDDDVPAHLAPMDGPARRAPAGPTEIGKALEQAMLELYTARTGIKIMKSPTLRHPHVPCVLATPDGLARRKSDGGAEVKIVGWRMAHHWAEESQPEYVEVQCRQGMAVTDRVRWGLIALVGGTDLRIRTIERDLEYEELIIESISRFWVDYVEGDTPPPEQSWEERREYLKLRYPGSEKTKCRELVNDGVVELIDRLAFLTKEKDRLLVEKEQVTNALIELVGADYGIEGPWGKFLHYTVRGHVDWKAVAEELAGGSVPAEMIERHRGESYRVPRYCEPSKKKARKA